MADQSNEDDDTSRIPPSDIWNNGLHNQHTSPAQSPLENDEEERVLQHPPPLSNGGFASEQHNIISSNGLSSILNPFNLRRSLPTTSLLMKRIGKTIAISSTAIFLLIVFPLLFNSAIHDAKMGRTDFAAFYSAASFVTITLVFSFREILSHLYNWYAPDVQKFVVRILFMVPLYSVQSWLSLRFHGPARVYIDTIRDLYEAYVIQSFVYYLIELLGGEERITEILSNKEPSLGQHHPRCMAKLLGRWEMGQDFLYKIKHGVLQYVVMKTVTTLLTTFVLLPSGYYGEGTFTYHSAYIYITAILNISVMYALYCLVKLFHAVKSDLRSPVNWHPVGKFLCVKGVVFFTWWQGVGINFLRWHGVIPDQVGSWSGDEVAGGIIDYLVCVEMVFFSIAHMFTFTYKEYLPEGMEEKKKSGIVGWLFEGIDKQRRKRNPNQQQPALQSALLHGDHHDEEEVVGFVDENGNIAESSYSPPSSSGFRRLEDPLRLREALWSSTVPTETLDDIKRLGVVSSQGYSYSQVSNGEESNLEQPSIDISLSSMQNAEKI